MKYMDTMKYIWLVVKNLGPFLSSAIIPMETGNSERHPYGISHRIHGTGIFTYMKTIRINQM